MKKIINVETGEVIERELNAEELAQQEIDEVNAKKEQAELAQKVAEKEAILNRLGLTAEELKVLLG